MTINNSSRKDNRAKIKYIDHKKGGDYLGLSFLTDKSVDLFLLVKNLWKYINGTQRVNHKNFPDSLGLATEIINLTSHTSTHMDAPYHFGPLNRKNHAMTIDEIPLSWCYGDGILLDLSMSIMKEQYYISLLDIKKALSRIKCPYNELYRKIVLIKTNCSYEYVGIEPRAIKFLIENGVKIIGTDKTGFDIQSMEMLKNYYKEKNINELWPAHIAGRNLNYCHIENLNLENFTISKEFTICCFPIKISKASAAWVRVIAIVEEERESENGKYKICKSKP